MSWTKLDIVRQAFDMIGLASYTYDLQSEQMESALRQLDAMVANWNLKGIRLGYPLPASVSTSDINDDTNVSDMALEALYQNLALRIASSIGKQVMPELKQYAFLAYQNLLSMSAKQPYEMQMPRTMPRGSGNKPWRYEGDEFVDGPVDPLLAGDDDIIEFD